jgi:hypothetical protein
LGIRKLSRPDGMSPNERRHCRLYGRPSRFRPPPAGPCGNTNSTRSRLDDLPARETRTKGACKAFFTSKSMSKTRCGILQRIFYRSRLFFPVSATFCSLLFLLCLPGGRPTTRPTPHLHTEALSSPALRATLQLHARRTMSVELALVDVFAVVPYQPVRAGRFGVMGGGGCARARVGGGRWVSALTWGLEELQGVGVGREW